MYQDLYPLFNHPTRDTCKIFFAIGKAYDFVTCKN